MASSLVSCDWLKGKIDSGNLGNIVILDVSWASDPTKFEGDTYADYNKKHIPGARYLNVLDAENTEMLVRNLPTAAKFTELAQKAGVNKSSHVVLYSKSDRAAFFMSGRGWWTFRVFGFPEDQVSILDGGIDKWESMGYSTTQDTPAITRGDFVASDSKSMYKYYEDVVENLKSKEYQVVDTRDNSLFTQDHIPNAVNLAMGNLIDEENKSLKKPRDLEKEFDKAGVKNVKDKPVIVHCKGGMGSCTVALAAELLGQKNVFVYHGGFTEWSKKYSGSK